MAMLAPTLTNGDFEIIFEALEEWTTLDPDDPSRQEQAVLIKARLYLQKNDPVPIKPIHNSLLDDHRLERAEQFIRECGIWIHFEAFLKDRRCDDIPDGPNQ